MQHALQVEILKELMTQLDEGKNIDAGVQYKMPTTSYVCPEMASLEKKEFFQNHPQLIGLTSDLPEPAADGLAAGGAVRLRSSAKLSCMTATSLRSAATSSA